MNSTDNNSDTIKSLLKSLSHIVKDSADLEELELELRDLESKHRQKKLAERLQDTVPQQSMTSLLASNEVKDRLFSIDRLEGYKTGLEDLDRLIDGLKVQSCIVIAAEPRMGKSLLSLSILVNLAKGGIKVCYFDEENGTAESLERLLRIWFGLSKSFFTDLTNMSKLDVMTKQISNISYYSHDHLNAISFKGKRIELILALMKQQVANGCKVFLVDPLQALETETDSGNRYNEQGFVIKALKEFAQTNNCVVIVNHHMRKASNSTGAMVVDIDSPIEMKYKIPSLEDMEGSSKIANFAHEVWGIVRTHSSPLPEKRRKILLRILKRRTGNCGDVRLYLDENTLRVLNNQDTYSNKQPNDIFNGEV